MILRHTVTYIALALTTTLSTCQAIWPFATRPIAVETWSLNSALGLDFVEGQVAAVGDWNGDQHLDLFVLSDDKKTVEIQQWFSSNRTFMPVHRITTANFIESVIPADYNQDGRLDVLVLTKGVNDDEKWWSSSKQGTLDGRVHIQTPSGITRPGVSINGMTKRQPLVIDAKGDLRPDLLGLGKGSDATDAPFLQLWTNFDEQSEASRFTAPLEPSSSLCQLTTPHSDAFVDLNGDCLADLFLTCEDPRDPTKRSFQVWLNNKNRGFVFAGEWKLPPGAGAITFADMDRDGTIDLVFPTCASVSSSNGVGKDCAINIAYNKQKPLCSTASDGWLAGFAQSVVAPPSSPKSCRDAVELCMGDSDFGFDLDSKSDSLTSIPIIDMFPDTGSLLFQEPAHPHLKTSPLVPLRIGDYNLDGFPDILALVSNHTAAPPPGGLFGLGRSSGIQAKVIQNVDCGRKHPACQDGKHKAKRRRFMPASGEPGLSVLESLWDVTAAFWFDAEDDGTLDILIERSGKQDGSRFAVFRNNVFRDAFFLKALVLNGACEGDMCMSASDGLRYSSYGANLPGASFKFAVLDTHGNRVPAQIPQMAQTAYRAVQTPYSFFGLGRTNNYIEKLFIGTTSHEPYHTTVLEGVIPNSHIVINPPLPPHLNASSEVEQGSVEWHKTLYLQPGKWIQWVVVTSVLVVLLLACVTYVLHLNERREDEAERKKTMHRINFAAFG